VLVHRAALGSRRAQPLQLTRKVLNLPYYSAAWTDSGVFSICEHHHKTVGEAFACIPCANGYVVAIEKAVIRPLAAEEEEEFQLIVHKALPGSQLPRKAESVLLPPREEGETLLEIAFHIMRAHGFEIQEADVRLTSMGVRDDPKLGKDRPNDNRDGCESQAA
jgi:hypothetical protein